MKYKLINSQTKEEHLCDKVAIDGFDYYVSDEIRNYFYDKTTNRIVKSNGDVEGYKKYSEYFNGVIATNNPNIDIPKVIDVVEELALKTTLQPKVLFEELKKCSQNDALLIDGYGEYNIIRYRETTGFINGYNKSQETYPFSEKDMTEFLQFYKNTARLDFNSTGENHGKTTKELLQLWKEQQPKIVYYDK